MQLVVLVFNGSGVPLSERSILGKHVVDRRPVMQLQSPDSVGRFTSSYSTVINDWLRPPLTVNVIGSVDVWGIRRRLEAVRMGVLSLWGTRLSQAKWDLGITIFTFSPSWDYLSSHGYLSDSGVSGLSLPLTPEGLIVAGWPTRHVVVWIHHVSRIELTFPPSPWNEHMFLHAAGMG